MSAQPKTPTTATAKAEEVKPLGNLKPTPALPMDFAAKLNAMKQLEQITLNLRRFETTKALLEAFKLEDNSNTNAQPYLSIKDSGYSGIEFKTHNVGIIGEVLDYITKDVEAKIKITKTQIAEFELPKI